MLYQSFKCMPVETGGEGGWGAAGPSPQIFAKVDLLIIDIYREKEKIANKKKTNSLKFL